MILYYNMFDYRKISQSLLENLPGRTKDIIERRFGLKEAETETLEAIGKSYGITRERVRQIQEAGFSKLKIQLKDHQAAFQYFTDHLKERGDLRKEDRLLKDLGKEALENQVFFLLSLDQDFQRFLEDPELYSLWTINEGSLDLAKNVTEALSEELREVGSPLPFEDIFQLYQQAIAPSLRELSQKPLLSYLEVSKKIEQGPQDFFGLPEWPEISPRGMRDRAFIALKQAGKPLHFREVASQINKLDFKKQQQALPQTVHNELIKDPRFVLVGRGLYVLREWGYEPGVVKDVIFRVLKSEKKSLSQEEIIKKVLEQRFVKASTVLVNLKKYFPKTKTGKYKNPSPSAREP